jgi:hypothetical protein
MDGNLARTSFANDLRIDGALLLSASAGTPLHALYEGEAVPLIESAFPGVDFRNLFLAALTSGAVSKGHTNRHGSLVVSEP